MSLFWSVWVTVLSIACWLFILVVLLATLKYRPKLEEDGTTGHEYDGIQEYDRPLPKWWLAVFFGTMIWGVFYVFLYPSLMPERMDGFATVKVDGEDVAWTSANELASELAINNQKFVQNFNEKILQDANVTDQLAELSKLQLEQRKNAEPNADLQKQINEKLVAFAPVVEKLSQNKQAIFMGQRLFLQNCALCHGSTAQGTVGYPNLTDNDWIYGGEAHTILQTILYGRIGGMPEWKSQIGEEGVRAVAEYVLSLSPNHGSKANGELNQTFVAQGKPIYEANCAVCHGADAKGNHQLGAVNLTDDIWLFGGDREAVRATIRHGRAGVMPEWYTKLGNERSILLASYIYSLKEQASKP